MLPVDIKMIQFLTVLVVRDDDKSSGTNPDPQIFLEGLCGIEGPYLSSSHFHKTKVCVNVITGLCVYVTEIMRQFDGTGPWICPVRWVLHVVIDDNIPALSINAHSIFIERPRMELLGVLITALLPVNLDVIVFRNVGLFVLRSMVFTVSLSIVIANSWAPLVMPSQWACLQRDLVTDPVRHGCPHRSAQRYGRNRALRAGREY